MQSETLPHYSTRGLPVAELFTVGALFLAAWLVVFGYVESSKSNNGQLPYAYQNYDVKLP